MHAIEMLCEEYGMTRYKLSKDSGVSQDYLTAQVRNGKSSLNIKSIYLKKIADALNLSMDELYYKLSKYEGMNVIGLKDMISEAKAVMDRGDVAVIELAIDSLSER